MVGIKIDQEKATYAFPVTQRGRYTVDREVFERLAAANLPAHPDGICNRVPIRNLPDTWPANALKEKAIEGARIFLRDMAAQGLEPITELEGLIVLGPYKHRRFHAKPTITGAKPMLSVVGQREDEDLDPGAADFILEGQFLERRGRIIEYEDRNGRQ